jgi:hypothetical protein
MKRLPAIVVAVATSVGTVSCAAPSVSGHAESKKSGCEAARVELVDGVAWHDATGAEPQISVILANKPVAHLDLAAGKVPAMAFLPLHDSDASFTKVVLVFRADGSPHPGGAAVESGACAAGFSPGFEITRLDPDRIAGRSSSPGDANHPVDVEFEFDLPIQKL